MITRFAGLWLGIVLIAGTSFAAIVLAVLFADAPSRVVIGLIWLAVVAWLAWGMWRSRVR